MFAAFIWGIMLIDVYYLICQEWAGHSRFIRVMPNTPAAVGVAASGIPFFPFLSEPCIVHVYMWKQFPKKAIYTVITLGEAATKEDEELISKLFGAIGKVWTAQEKLFDAITGLRYSILISWKLNKLVTCPLINLHTFWGWVLVDIVEIFCWMAVLVDRHTSSWRSKLWPMEVLLLVYLVICHLVSLLKW